MKATAAPQSAGLDSTQLDRLDRHFRRYVDDGRLAGWQIVVSRRGEVAHATMYGTLRAGSDEPVREDTLWRVYSMTKPITTVAAMMLWEEGRLELTDPISNWLPEFADMRVYDKGSIAAPFTVPALEPIRVWHLMTHTSGLTYGHLQNTVVDAIYRANGFDFATINDFEISDACRRWASMPLLFQPGTRWGYSVGADVLGRIVEVITGASLAVFCAERIFGPLGMTDARWWVSGEDTARLAGLHAVNPANGKAAVFEAMEPKALAEPGMYGGGAGLICTAADYHRFMEMLRNEGTLGDVRLLGSRTVRYMTSNHLPGGADIGTLNTGGFAETIYDGVGFGLGFAVVIDPIPARYPSSPGTYYWGGAASTAFWIDPIEDLTVAFYTQLAPSSSHPIRPQLRQLVYAALI